MNGYRYGDAWYNRDIKLGVIKGPPWRGITA
jgi:hypothetical protein